MDEWLTRARDALADASGATREELTIDDSTQAILLELASVAAHESGERINAPLLCYLVGLAEGRSAKAVDELARAVR